MSHLRRFMLCAAGIVASVSACSSDDKERPEIDFSSSIVDNDTGVAENNTRISGTGNSTTTTDDTETTEEKDTAENEHDFVSPVVETDSSETETVEDTDTKTDTAEIDTSGCGNGVIESAEVCDDGNSVSGDGCSAMCDAQEDGFVCSVPGERCAYIVVCGDGQIYGSETCDDFNTDAQDGCSQDCQVEVGWQCPVPGERCVAAACGDGLIAGKEDCDDGNKSSTDGCSDSCRLEEGWACSAAGVACHKTVCNDGVKEGKEPCDDGNVIIGDGCTPFCEKEPDCSNGACTSACGDGIILPGDDEECDDGNLQNNDGCSAECQIESGYVCDNVEQEPPEILEVPITYRDLIAIPAANAARHPDLQAFTGVGITPGLLRDTLGDDGKPIYTGICERGSRTGFCPQGDQTTSEKNFLQWYNDDPSVNKTSVARLSLRQQRDGTYFFDSNEFFPLDDDGWVAAGKERVSFGHNFGFTSELRYWFEYKGNEVLRFRGDDDVWVFINNQLAVDIGGVHLSEAAGITLNERAAETLGLEKGNIYEIVLFHAERQTGYSRYNLTLSGFTTIQSQCQSDCGDGIVAGEETCDDGVNDGSYGSCMPDCTRGPRCGDGVLQAAEEACDDGVNLTVYSGDHVPGCAPGCVPGAYCGDGVLNGLFGEQCDDGVNDGGYGKCAGDCTLDIRCGDSVVQPEHDEECDDGNSVSGDGCSLDCLIETVVVL